MTDINKEFADKALFDLDFIKGEQHNLTQEAEKAVFFNNQSAEHQAEAEKEQQKANLFEARTFSVKRVAENLSQIKKKALRQPARSKRNMLLLMLRPIGIWIIF